MKNISFYSKSRIPILILLLVLFPAAVIFGQGNTFTMKEVRSYPFPSGLCTSETSSRIAWTIEKEGQRNIFTAEGPDFEVKKISNYNLDDGQAISSLSISKDGLWCVYIRGGDFGSNWSDEEPVNARGLTTPPEVRIWSVRFDGGEPYQIANGINPVISPDCKTVAFTKNGQIWTVPIDGSGIAKMLFNARGNNGSPTWSSDGKMLAFRSSRGDHSYIGVFRGPDRTIKWIAPDYNHDRSPAWSKDGKYLAFVRTSGSGGTPNPALAAVPRPWKIMITSMSSFATITAWESPNTMEGSVPSTHGGTNLRWGKDRLTFLSYHDGWPHIYSIGNNGGEPELLTPGNFMAEYISVSSSGNKLAFCGNTGPDEFDIDRRHIVMVSTDNPDMQIMTPGIGNEWTPFITGDGRYMAFIGATPKTPPLVKVMKLSDRSVRTLAANGIPDNFPEDQLVVPYQVKFKSEDGTLVHGTVFDNKKIEGIKPAVIFVHGGPQRQMLLGWHYSSYYSNAYAINQYLAARGFVVVSVNFRLGIGYGYKFHKPLDGGTRGASEYQDVVAAHSWLSSQTFVDPNRIGLYGGSYGGYLTAMALGKNSDLFAAGVDISGVHNRTVRRSSQQSGGYEKVPDAELALKIAWESSPIAHVKGWKSPGLIIHADDDRNVDYNQSTDLVVRLRKLNAPIETISIVDDTHHFMVYANQAIVNQATVDFLIKHLKK